MAIQRIPGELLQTNLTRSGVDLAFETNLLYLDVTNMRVGIGTSSPGAYKLDVSGDVRITGDLSVVGTTTTIDSNNLTVEDNILTLNSGSSQATSSGILINRGSSNPAVLYWDEANDKFKVVTTTSDGSTTSVITDSAYAKMAGADPSAADDFVTKRYFEANAAGGSVVGTSVTLGTPTDSSFGDGSLTTLGSASSVTDALDDLNETMENIRNSTYVKSVNFTADVTTGSAGLVVTLTITTVGGGANRYDITWGDGDTTSATTDSTPSHTYSTNSGSPFDVTVKAYNSSATANSSGSFATKTREDFVTIFTAQPVPNFFIYAASSGGSPITLADTGATVYLKNETTNTSMGSVTYEVDWGDTTTSTIASDSAAGGVGAARLSHTYNNSAGDDGSTVGTGTGDTRYTIKLKLLTHTTADPSVIPANTTKSFDVYSTHTVAYSVADSTIRGINEESTSGFPVTFTNNTATNPGAQSTFTSNVYSWNFGEGAGNQNVNVGSNASGDTSRTIANTFNLSTGQQNAKTTVTYTTSLSLANGHSTSPFAADMKIIVEPDLRANIAATADIVSGGSGDNQYTVYDVIDLDSANRALTTFTNTSQHAENYFYDFKDDSSDTLSIVEDGSTAGTIGATLSKNWAGVSAGSYTTRFRASGTPDTIFQDDDETLTITMKSTPSAPANLSAKSLTLSDSAQGTSPKLCHGFTDNTSSFTTQSAGDSLSTTTARRYTSGTIDTNTVTNFLTNNSNGTGATVNQTVTAKINNGAKGARTFTTSEGGGNNTTDDTLVTTNHRDYDEVDGAYPQRMYLVATAKITEALTDYSIGSNAQRLESTAGGNTNIVHVVRDDVTASPTATIGTVTQNAAGNLRYISGVPYYNDGSPSLTVTGSTIANFTGQAYRDTSSPVEIDPGTNHESTSGSIISNTNFTYANVDGSTTMLSSGTPKANTGVGGAYTLGALTVSLLNTQRRSIQSIKMRASNCNGTSAYSENATKIQMYSNTLLTMDNEQGGITVSDSLGATYDDDALRIYDFAGDTTDTPSYNGSTNFYTNNLFTGAKTVAGTREAICRFGTISHFTTDLSSGYLPVGPDLNTGRSNAHYYTFAFRRSTVSQFSITLSGKVSGAFIALPGEGTDTSSGANGWLDCSTQYNGSGQPGSGTGGNGSDGVAKTGGDRIIDNTTYSSQTFDITLGTASMSNSTGNVCLVRFKLESGDSITALSIGTV